MRAFLLTILFLSSLTLPAFAGTVEVQSGRSVVVATPVEIDSGNIATGQTLDLEVKKDVSVTDAATGQSVVIIRAGTPVVGRVLSSKGSGSVGEGGRLSITIESTEAVDGTPIDLVGSISMRGEDREGTTIALGVIFCPLFLLGEGDDAIVPAGVEVRARTTGTHFVSVEGAGVEKNAVPQDTGVAPLPAPSLESEATLPVETRLSMIDLGSYRSADAAMQAYSDVRQRNPGLLNTFEPLVKPSTGGGSFSLFASPTAANADSVKTCRALSQNGEFCFAK